MKILRYILLITIIGVSAQAFAAEDFENLARVDLCPLYLNLHTEEFSQSPLERLFENYTTDNFDKMVVYARESLKAERHWKKFYELLPSIRARDEDGFFALRQIFAIPLMNYLGRVGNLDRNLSSVFQETSFDPTLSFLENQSEVFKKMKIKWDTIKTDPLYDEKRLFIEQILTDFSQYSILQGITSPISLRDIHISSLRGENIQEILEVFEGFINNQDTPLWLFKETNCRIQFLKKYYGTKLDPALEYEIAKRICVNPDTTGDEITRLWKTLPDISIDLQYDLLMSIGNPAEEFSRDFETLRLIAEKLSSFGEEYRPQAQEFWKKVLYDPIAYLSDIKEAIKILIESPYLDCIHSYQIIERIFSFPTMDVDLARALRTIRENKPWSDLQTKCLVTLEGQAWLNILNNACFIDNIAEAAEKLSLSNNEFYKYIMEFYHRTDESSHTLHTIKFITKKLSSFGEEYRPQAQEFWRKVLHHPQADIDDVKKIIEKLITDPRLMGRDISLDATYLYKIIERIFSFPTMDVDLARALRTIRENKPWTDLQTKCLVTLEVQAWLSILNQKREIVEETKAAVYALSYLGKTFQNTQALKNIKPWENIDVSLYRGRGYEIGINPSIFREDHFNFLELKIEDRLLDLRLDHRTFLRSGNFFRQLNDYEDSVLSKELVHFLGQKNLLSRSIKNS